MPGDNPTAGLATSISGTNVSQVTVATGGVINVTTSIAGVPSGNSLIVFEPTPSPSGITWTCTGGNLDNQYRPSNCKP